MRPTRKEAVKLATVCAANFASAFALLIPFFLNVLQQAGETSALAQTVAVLAAAALVSAGLHELLHVEIAKALGSRAAVRVFHLGFQTLFLDPLPLWKTALVYLAPLFAASVPLTLHAAGLPGVYTALWVSMCVGDIVALLQLLAEKPKSVVCTLKGRVVILR